MPGTGQWIFEWRKEGKLKHPYFIRFRDESPMFLAGLYDEWSSEEDGEVLTTFTIITIDANAHVSETSRNMTVAYYREIPPMR